MTDKETVTIIVPVYNVEDYIEKCLLSLIKQTYKNIVIYAISDGSRDRSVEKIKKVMKLDSRITLFEKENGGYGSVLEFAIDKIKTKYFLICDPDDWLEDTAVEKLYTIAEKDNLDLLIGDRYSVYINEDAHIYTSTFYSALGIKPGEVYTEKEGIQKFAFGLVSPHAKLFRTAIAKNINFPHNISYTDLVLYLVSLSRARRVAYINEALAYYLLDRPGNTNTDVRPSVINDYMLGFNSILKQIKVDDNVLYFRMYYQLKFIIREYARIKFKNSNNKYWNCILKGFKNLQVRKRCVYRGFFGSLKERLILQGFMNPIMYKYVAMRYLCEQTQRKVRTKDEK